MTLKEKYTIKNKKRMPQFIFLYSILVVFFAMYSSLAKYEKISEGFVKIAVAQWNIALNGKRLTSCNNNILEDSIVLIPAADAEDAYFDITIDPTGTEVSFEYQVALELPDGFHISSYSLDGGATRSPLPENNTLNSTVPLGGRSMFTDGDIQTIRYYWADDEDENTAVYTIAANVEVKQVL